MNVQEAVIEPDYLNYQGPRKGIFAWILSTDHKRIGLLYLFSFLVFFSVAATIGLLMKFELIAPIRIGRKKFPNTAGIPGMTMAKIIIMP